MIPPRDKGIPRPGRREVVRAMLAILVLAWRLFACPAESLWRDWIAILAIYWIYTEFRSRAREWPTVTAAVTAYLLGIYVHGQIPFTMSVLGFLP